jgi:TrpR-related protein YerC/YecD
MAMYEAIMELNSVEECCKFFDDLCAVTELRAMEQRYDVAVLLSQERVYTDIMEVTSASSATISRVNRMLNYGTGCLGEVVERQQAHKSEQETS